MDLIFSLGAPVEAEEAEEAEDLESEKRGQCPATQRKTPRRMSRRRKYAARALKPR